MEDKILMNKHYSKNRNCFLNLCNADIFTNILLFFLNTMDISAVSTSTLKRIF